MRETQMIGISAEVGITQYGKTTITWYYAPALVALVSRFVRFLLNPLALPIMLY
jgi:hypothetical protein